MRVLVNQTTALTAKTGIGQYTHSLLAALRALAPEHQFDVFPPDWLSGVRRLVNVAQRWPARQSGTPRDNTAPRFSARGFADHVMTGYLRLANWWRPCDLYHEPNTIPLPASMPTVATIHDLSLLMHPQWHPLDRVRFFERHFERGLQQCSHLLAVSEFTRREVMREFNVTAEKITRTHLGARAGMRPMDRLGIAPELARLGLPSEYLLFVGTLEPRKNPLLMMKAYVDLPRQVRERCPLVLAGGWGWHADAFRDYYEQEARHQFVVHLGYVHDEDLPVLYNGARALVFPTHYEGFGLPPLEMMACGGAVLASTAEAVVEIVGRKAHLLDADDLAGWRDAMGRAILDDDWLNEMRAGACEWAAEYSWETCARQTLGVYRRVCGLTAKHDDGQLRLAS